MQIWLPTMSILSNMLSPIAFLDILAVDGLGHHILLISAPPNGNILQKRNHPHRLDELENRLFSSELLQTL
jgi:hypothetical protein